jgi:predicted aspartyl protease
MRINGKWSLCDDGIIRPVIRGEILTSNGSWVTTEFLVDTGADRTVISALILEALRLQPIAIPGRIGGVGGLVDSVNVETQIRFTQEAESKVVFRGQYAAVTEVEALDMSVLGRDITSLFAVIVDRPSDVVCLLGQRHRYTIEQS